MGGLQKGGSRIPLRLKEVGVSYDYYDEIKLRNNDESDQISVKVYDKNGNQYTRGNNFVGVFADNNQSYSVRTEVQYANDAKAGLYTGYMCFEFEIVAS